MLDIHGNIWITDFGLARLQDDAGLTITGDLLGTLRYMSPEQALAQRGYLDHRTDIYSLGATLYELVTLRPAVDGQDRQEILRKIAQEEPIPLRRLNPAIPREIETILLKAMDKEPGSRYPSARELADDLRRFIEHKPIKAKRPSLVERAGKWSRRHPGLVASVVSGLLLAVFGLTASLVTVNRERARTTEKAREVRRLAERLEWELYVSRVSQAQGDWHAGNLARADSALQACAVQLRNWEWRYVWKLCHQEIYSVLSHDLPYGLDSVPVFFTTDGMHWISAAGTTNMPAGAGSLKCCDALTGACVWDRGEEQLTGIRALALSPAGGLFAVAFANELIPIQLRDVTTGRLIGVLPAPRRWEETRNLAFSSDGRSLAQLREPGTLVVWDVASRREVFHVKAHPAIDGALAFHPGGEIVATGGRDGVIRLWKSRTGEQLKALKGHDWIIMDLAFSPDGLRLASGGWDQTLRTWDVERGAPLKEFSGHDGFVHRVCYSPDGSRLAAVSGQAIVIRDATTGRELFSLRGQSHFGTGLDFTPDGSRLVVSSQDGRVQVFDATTPEPRVLRGDGWINCLSFAPDGKSLVAAQAHSNLVVWDTDSGQRRLALKGHDDAVRTAAFTSDGSRIVSACWDGSAGIWDAATGRELRTLAAGDRPRKNRAFPGGIAINTAAVSHDGRLLATGGWDRNVRLWDIATGAAIRAYGNHRATVWSLAFSPDGRLIASAGEDRRIRVSETNAGREVWSASSEVPVNGSTTRQIVAFTPDGRLLAGCVEFGMNPSTPIKFWESATGAEVMTIRHTGGQVNALAFSPDGTRLATAGEDRTVQLWDVASGQNVLVLRGHIASVLSVAFSPDGANLASGSVDATVRIWHAPSTTDRPAASSILPTSPSKSYPRTVTGMEKKRSPDNEGHRFRAEAAARLGVTANPKAT